MALARGTQKPAAAKDRLRRFAARPCRQPGEQVPLPPPRPCQALRALRLAGHKIPTKCHENVRCMISCCFVRVSCPTEAAAMPGIAGPGPSASMLAWNGGGQGPQGRQGWRPAATAALVSRAKGAHPLRGLRASALNAAGFLHTWRSIHNQHNHHADTLFPEPL